MCIWVWPRYNHYSTCEGFYTAALFTCPDTENPDPENPTCGTIETDYRDYLVHGPCPVCGCTKEEWDREQASTVITGYQIAENSNSRLPSAGPAYPYQSSQESLQTSMQYQDQVQGPLEATAQYHYQAEGPFQPPAQYYNRAQGPFLPLAQYSDQAQGLCQPLAQMPLVGLSQAQAGWHTAKIDMLERRHATEAEVQAMEKEAREQRIDRNIVAAMERRERARQELKQLQKTAKRRRPRSRFRSPAHETNST